MRRSLTGAATAATHTSAALHATIERKSDMDEGPLFSFEYAAKSVNAPRIAGPCKPNHTLLYKQSAAIIKG
jgi:hypothetical protein